MQQTQEESKTAVTAIAEYSATEATLAELRARLKDARYEVTTTAGMDTAKKDRRELVTLRTDLEKKRVEIKAPALERCRLIDAEAKRITGELLLLEKPIDDQIKAEEARKEAIAAEKRRIEEERVGKIRERIQRLNNIPLMAAGMSSADLELFIARVEAQQIGADFAEYQQEATEAKAEVIGKLKEAMAATLAREEELAKEKLRQEEENARLEEERERLAAEKAEQDRLNAIEQEKIAAERAELEALRETERKRQEAAAKVEAEKQAQLDAEREALRKEQEELNRKERERLEKEQAEQAERDRIAREKAEKEAEEKRAAELKAAQEEHEATLAKATETHKATLESILAAAEDQTLSAPAALQHIVILAKRGLGRKA